VSIRYPVGSHLFSCNNCFDPSRLISLWEC